MRKINFVILSIFLTLFVLGFSSSAFASGTYTESITIDGSNNVEYNYFEHPPKESDNEEPEQNTNTYIHVRPYQYTTWSHYPRYNYHNYNPYGGQVIYTYNSTGIKTGPDGRMITPLMEREMYDYHIPQMPPPPPFMHGGHPSHRPTMHPNHFRH